MARDGGQCGSTFNDFDLKDYGDGYRYDCGHNHLG